MRRRPGHPQPKRTAFFGADMAASAMLIGTQTCARFLTTLLRNCPFDDLAG